VNAKARVADHGRVAAWVVALIAFAAAIAGATWWSIDRGQDQNPSWLFSHTADAGTLKQNSDGGYTLTLTGIDPHVMAFTDRPARDSQILPTAGLIEVWPTLFADSPPNAVLVEHNASGNTDSVVLTLTNPKLTSSALTFNAVVITDEHPANLKRLTRGIHKTAPATFANATLFIDEIAQQNPGTAELFCPSLTISPTAGDPAAFAGVSCEFFATAPAQ